LAVFAGDSAVMSASGLEFFMLSLSLTYAALTPL
jgi:hypothetical protein